MFLIDQIEAACIERGLPVDLPERRSERFGNMAGQYQYTESRAGRLVRQLEDHARIHPSRRAGPLGQRFVRSITP